MPKDKTADKLLVALMGSRTHEEAAKKAGVSVRTLYGYLAKLEFQEAYKLARDDALRGVTSDLRGHMIEEVDVVASIMNNSSANAYVRLTAARTVIDYSLRYTETTEILDRLAAIEARLDNKG
jgi:transposase